MIRSKKNKSMRKTEEVKTAYPKIKKIEVADGNEIDKNAIRRAVENLIKELEDAGIY